MNSVVRCLQGVFWEIRILRFFKDIFFFLYNILSGASEYSFSGLRCVTVINLKLYMIFGIICHHHSTCFRRISRTGSVHLVVIIPQKAVIYNAV